MLVLALDTTTRGGSCALACDGVVVREEGSDASLAPASRLPRDLMALLDHAAASLQDVDVLAVATGPGSFTGLRVGIATMQGLAFAQGKPLIGVSTFDALAAIDVRGPLHSDRPSHRPDWPERIATWVDAWRGEVFAALYEDGRAVGAPTVAHPDEWLARLAASPTVFTGDGALIYRDAILRKLGGAARFAEPVSPLLAGRIARLASDAARAGERPPPHAIRPLYVRRSDAELARDARATH